MSASWDGRPGIVPARRIRPGTDWGKVIVLLWCIFAPWLVLVGTLLYLDWLP